ncbi:MAG: TetR/AcrR family transcriptional regulator [Bacillota bacterium]|nr:TetR/AcrR family transcriptional regulator [Bacillota bacterium]
METDKVKVSREIILEKTLALVDERDGIRNVTLRDIAKEVGCAHTNLYNYFGSLEDIFWEALGKVLNKLMEFSISGLSTESDPEESVNHILSRFMDFSMDHPGWYRLIWLDSLSGKPSPEVEAVLEAPAAGFTELIRTAKDELTPEQALSIGNVMLCYLHGELCIWLNDRSFLKDRQQVRQKIQDNLRSLYKLLIL